jgi:hypothetical protein
MKCFFVEELAAPPAKFLGCPQDTQKSTFQCEFQLQEEKKKKSAGAISGGYGG